MDALLDMEALPTIGLTAYIGPHSDRLSLHGALLKDESVPGG